MITNYEDTSRWDAPDTQEDTDAREKYENYLALRADDGRDED